jgi:hypothetical protein
MAGFIRSLQFLQLLIIYEYQNSLRHQLNPMQGSRDGIYRSRNLNMRFRCRSQDLLMLDYDLPACIVGIQHSMRIMDLVPRKNIRWLRIPFLVLNLTHNLL